jgi:hypothetical protein
VDEASHLPVYVPSTFCVPMLARHASGRLISLQLKTFEWSRVACCRQCANYRWLSSATLRQSSQNAQLGAGPRGRNTARRPRVRLESPDWPSPNIEAFRTPAQVSSSIFWSRQEQQHFNHVDPELRPFIHFKGRLATMIRPSSTACNIAVACTVFFFILLGFSTRGLPRFRGSGHYAAGGHAYIDDVFNSTLGVFVSLQTGFINADEPESSKRSSQSISLPERTIVMRSSWPQLQATSRSTGSTE